ncbi:lipid storage droplets surface-binding protein 2-like [Oppia nitens]|uniref:lipid storage droplets surface-binding protein 2-like n=1 Tax=Oppia nitens TaxID=1686743 RepID=UPI0023DC2978|nr:lipid storage droplets surface-binding protein 2-like [Oppia nitens]
MASNSSVLKMEALNKLSSLPLIKSAIGIASDGYSRFKAYNGLISATLSKAEQSLLFVATTAKPMIDKFEKPITFADNIACQGIDKLEEKLPAIKKSPEEIKDDTKRIFSGIESPIVNRIEGMRKYSTDTFNEMKDYSYNKVNGVLHSSYIQVFRNSIDTAIELTHNAVDHYFPPADNEPKVETIEDQTLGVRMSNLSEKIRRRVYNQLTNKWVPTVSNTVNTLRSNWSNWTHHNNDKIQ